LRASSRVSHQDPKRGTRDGPALPPAVRSTRGLVGGRSPSRCNLGKFSRPSHGFSLFADFPLGGLFVMLAKLHLAEDAFTLQLFLQRSQSLVDVVIANQYLHETFPSLNRDAPLGLQCFV